MALEKRSEQILNAVIEGFVKTGIPISSAWLCQNFDFGIKSAMIRHELEDLTELGYLDQPYYSSGRIPSDKGYEFFVEQILDQDEEAFLDKEIAKLFNEREWPEFLDIFTNRLGILGVVELDAENRVYKTGLEKLVSQINLENQNILKTIIHDFECLEENLKILNENFTENEPIQIFIGKKSPITESPELSVIMQKCNQQDEEILLLAIGPKRMNYKKVVKTLKGIQKIND